MSAHPSKKEAAPAQPAHAGFKPVVTFRPTAIPQGNGRYLIEPGKPIIAQREDEVGTREFARATGLSQRHVLTLADEGKIKHRRKSPKAKSELLIPRSEVARYLNILETDAR